MTTGNSNLLISAVGEGQRMKMFTFENSVPKCLLSAGCKTILEQIIECYDDIVDNVYVICQEQHATMIQSILDFTKPNSNIHIISLAEMTKSPYESIRNGVTELINMGVDVNSSSWYINWSDVFCKDIPTNLSKSTIFLDSNYIHRNLGFTVADNTRMVVSTIDNTGNVPGMFYLTGDDMAMLYFDYEQYNEIYADIDKYIVNRMDIDFDRLSEVIDTGDYVKYTKFMSEFDNSARYFNRIEINDKTVDKQPIDEQGYKLHDIEVSFYRKYGHKVKSLCRLERYDRDNKIMTLERIRGRSCQEFVDTADVERKTYTVNSTLRKFDKAIKQFHSVEVRNKPARSEEIAAAWKEFVEMIDVRVKPVLPLIENVIKTYDIKEIDGMPITQDYDKILTAVNEWFEKNKDTFEFGVCHGDPNTDNSLYTTKGIRFIDPRGFFGGLSTLGWSCKQYDYAKFAYGFSGYSRFTNSKFIATKIENGNLKTFIDIAEIEGITDTSIFDMDIDDTTRVLIGIIWLKLTSYIINSPTKSVLAYLHGNALVTKLLNIQ